MIVKVRMLHYVTNGIKVWKGFGKVQGGESILETVEIYVRDSYLARSSTAYLVRAVKKSKSRVI